MRLKEVIIKRTDSGTAVKHFSKELCEWASSLMRRADGQPVSGLYDRETLDALYARTGIRPLNNHDYDDVYVANMCKADFWGSSITDEIHLVKYIRDVIDDADAHEGQVLARFLADCEIAGIEVKQ